MLDNSVQYSDIDNSTKITFRVEGIHRLLTFDKIPEHRFDYKGRRIMISFSTGEIMDMLRRNRPYIVMYVAQ